MLQLSSHLSLSTNPAEPGHHIELAFPASSLSASFDPRAKKKNRVQTSRVAPTNSIKLSDADAALPPKKAPSAPEVSFERGAVGLNLLSN